MKKYFLYELKQARWQLVIISAIFTIVCATIAGVIPMQMEWEDYSGAIQVTKYSPISWLPVVMLTIMCYVAPAMSYSFKMDKRSVDCYYALPLKKTKLYFIKTMVGLLRVLIPFTAAFWTMFLVYMVRPDNPYQMAWFVPAYFGALFFGVCLYGYNAFAFTRANSTPDGIVFMIVYSFVMVLVAFVSFTLSKGELFHAKYLLNFVAQWDGIFYAIYMEEMMLGQSIMNMEMNFMNFLMPLLRGAAGYALLFSLLRYEKAEDSQQVCESWFGYKTLIPICATTIIGLVIGLLIEVSLTVSVILFVMMSVVAFVLTIVWRRKFTFGGKGWIVLGSGLGGALTLAILVAIVL